MNLSEYEGKKLYEEYEKRRKKQYTEKINKWREDSKKFINVKRVGFEGGDSLEVYSLEFVLTLDPFYHKDFPQNKIVTEWLKILQGKGIKVCDRWMDFLEKHPCTSVTGPPISLSFFPTGLGDYISATCKRCKDTIKLDNPDEYKWM